VLAGVGALVATGAFVGAGALVNAATVGAASGGVTAAPALTAGATVGADVAVLAGAAAAAVGALVGLAIAAMSAGLIVAAATVARVVAAGAPTVGLAAFEALHAVAISVAALSISSRSTISVLRINQRVVDACEDRAATSRVSDARPDGVTAAFGHVR